MAGPGRQSSPELLHRDDCVFALVLLRPALGCTGRAGCNDPSDIRDGGSGAAYKPAAALSPGNGVASAGVCILGYYGSACPGHSSGLYFLTGMVS